MPKKLDESTVIQFNMKWFISIIIAIVTFFVTFYFTVQKPNNDEVKSHMTELMEKEREYQDLRFEKLDEMQQSVDDLKKSVEDLNRRNGDLMELRNRISDTGAEL